MVRTAALVFGLVASAQHYSPAQERAIAAVKAQLKDPESATFRGLRIGKDGSGCGWVNAKNSYGGYIGFGVFYLDAKGKVALLPPDLSEPSLCE